MNACRNFKHGYDSGRWLAPDVLAQLQRMGIARTPNGAIISAERIEKLCRDHKIECGSSSDILVVDYYANKFIEYTRIGIGPTVHGVWMDCYERINFPRQGIAIEEAETLASKLSDAIAAWKKIDVQVELAKYQDSLKAYPSAGDDQ